jgi:OmpR family response regulator RpaB
VVNDSKRKILIVENEANISSIISTRFLYLGYDVSLSTNGAEALIIFNQECPDLVIIDILLPKIDGYEVCRRIRKKSRIPIIILTALNKISNRIMGLKMGADDYMTKPFSLTELELRVISKLRRPGSQKFKVISNRQETFQFGNLVVNTANKQILKNNNQLTLTSIEFSLLELLIQNSGRELSRAEILNNIWGYTPARFVDTRLVDVHIYRLRLKIEDTPSTPDFILTARGTGYIFQPFNL